MPERLNPQPKVLFEQVKYRNEDIAHAGISLINHFAKYSEIMGTREWTITAMQMVSDIRDQSPKALVFPARGINVIFSGFPQTLEARTLDTGVIFSAKEPRFDFVEQTKGLRPWELDVTEKAAIAIALEMNEVYRLRFVRNPLTLVFPKNEYGEVRVVDARLLGKS